MNVDTADLTAQLQGLEERLSLDLASQRVSRHWRRVAVVMAGVTLASLGLNVYDDSQHSRMATELTYNTQRLKGIEAVMGVADPESATPTRPTPSRSSRLLDAGTGTSKAPRSAHVPVERRPAARHGTPGAGAPAGSPGHQRGTAGRSKVTLKQKLKQVPLSVEDHGAKSFLDVRALVTRVTVGVPDVHHMPQK